MKPGRLTKSGDRLLVTLVLGLSWENSRRRWEGRCLTHSSSWPATERSFETAISYPPSEGYTCSKALFKILDAANSAIELEMRVDSPGRVGKNPVSVTFSSSISSGYSVRIPSSRSRTGRPVKAAVKLDMVRHMLWFQSREYTYRSRRYWHQKTFFRVSPIKGLDAKRLWLWWSLSWWQRLTASPRYRKRLV